MNLQTETEQPTPESQIPDYSVPWKFIDNWIGVILLALIQGLLAIIILQSSKTELAQNAAIVLFELVYILPVILILAWRRVSWSHLGFGRFEWKILGLGCGLLVVAYGIIILHNAVLYFLGVDTQGAKIAKMFAELDSPFWFSIAAALVAPFVEETFFRGFLFQGFREHYGWKVGMLLSSAIFAAAHLDLVVLIPTFILGNVLAYVYHRSNSVWPGIVLHFLVNSFGLCGAYFATHYQSFIPV
jgi:CAAX protease family protein